MTLWAPRSRPGYMINRIARLMARVVDRQLRGLGVGAGALPVLAMLNDIGPLSQKALATMAEVEQPSMAQTLARMERDGLIHRDPDPNDKRSSLISLSARAVEVTPSIMAILDAGNEQAMAGFDEHERRQLLDLLRRLIVNLEVMASEPGDVDAKG